MAQREQSDILPVLEVGRALDEQYLEDLHKRADTGTLSLSSVRRYQTALSHYLDFITEPAVAKAYFFPVHINRAFRLGFIAYLANKPVRTNRKYPAKWRPLKGQSMITETVRAMLEWAADPERGNILPDFRPLCECERL